jgi:hypothetical protein
MTREEEQRLVEQIEYFRRDRGRPNLDENDGDRIADIMRELLTHARTQADRITKLERERGIL